MTNWKKRAKVIKIKHLTFRKRLKEQLRGRPQAVYPWTKTVEMNEEKHFRR